MENDDIYKIWKKTDSLVSNLDKEQLKSILMKKNKKIFYEFVGMLVTSVVISIGAIVFLTIAAINRHTDVLYVSLNSLLILLILMSLVSYMYLLKRLKPNYSEKTNIDELIRHKVDILRKSCKQYKFQNFIMIGFILLINLSIHVFFERKPFLDAFSTPVSIIGFILGLAIGVSLGIYLARKIVVYFNEKIMQLRKNLDDLETNQASFNS